MMRGMINLQPVTLEHVGIRCPEVVEIIGRENICPARDGGVQDAAIFII